MERPRTARRPRRAAVALLAAVAVALSACGSDTTGPTANAPAGAKENAVGDAACFDWPNGTVAKPCAIDLKGPGGGRIFYDAGTTQPWGRFLEVAPQDWNGKLYKCPGSGLIGSTCAQPRGSEIAEATGDAGGNEGDTDKPGYSYKLCPGIPGYGDEMSEQELQAAVAEGLYVDTGAAIGDGRANTDFASNWQRCTGAYTTAFMVAKAYRDGSQNDWYLPSVDELRELCRFDGRTAMGGFVDANHHRYLSSTLYVKKLSAGDLWNYLASIIQMDKSCSEAAYVIVSADRIDPNHWQTVGLVRPIRAF